MNRYEKENAVDKIMGYYYQSPCESVQIAFERAKAELLLNMKKSIENIEKIKVTDSFPKLKVKNENT